MSAVQILKRQGYKELRAMAEEPASIWQGPDGRRVMVEDGRIYDRVIHQDKTITFALKVNGFRGAATHVNRDDVIALL